MKQEKKIELVYFIVIGMIFFCLLYTIMYVIINTFPEFNDSESLNNNALLHLEVFEWAYNINDPSEMFFDYTVYNFGNSEAKNIKVICKLFNEQENLVTSDSHYFGNIASNSYKIGELITDNININSEEYYIPLCYIESCEDCEILADNIPKLKEVYETN